jgi:hypothetical protein
VRKVVGTIKFIIKVDVTEVRLDGVDPIDLAQDRDGG